MGNQNKHMAKKLTTIFFMFGLAFAALIGHLAWIQLVQGEEFTNKALQKRLKDTVIIPPRGIITDRNGNELVTNTKVDSIYAIPEKIVDPRWAAGVLSTILELDENELFDKLNSDHSFAWIKRMVDSAISQKVKDLDITGIVLIKENSRQYVRGSMASHLIGFTGIDNLALMGVEKSFDEELKGIPGELLAEYGAKGRKIPGSTYRYQEPVWGSQLTLTIDENIQYFVERELDHIMEKYNPKLAVALVMEPHTGEILAMGNRPAFDCNQWEHSPEDVWNHNPAIWYNYEPGSTFKAITAVAALEEGTVHLDDTFYDPGFKIVSGTTIKCWKEGGHGYQKFGEVLENSCNPGMIEVGLNMGKENFYKYIEGFGFGRETGIDLPGEASGILRPVGEVTNLDLATMSIGQSIAVTPIQLASAISAIANGGKLMKPQLVKKITAPGGELVKEIRPEEIRQVVSGETAGEVRLILEKVVSRGTGNKAFIDGYRVAGKTGTAEVVGKSGYVQGKFVASFTGFAPADNPAVTLLVMIAEPKTPQHTGGEIAAPSFKTIAEETLRYLGIDRDYEAIHVENSQPKVEDIAQVRVPDVKNFPAGEAKSLLEASGFVVEAAGRGGLVQGQNPTPGTMVNKGGRVGLILGDHDQEDDTAHVVMPNFKGLTIKKTAAVIQELGLQLNVEGSGLAIKQSIEPGKKVVKGSQVKVTFTPPGSG